MLKSKGPTQQTRRSHRTSTSVFCGGLHTRQRHAVAFDLLRDLHIHGLDPCRRSLGRRTRCLVVLPALGCFQ